MLLMLASVKVESKDLIANLPVVCEFHDVFLDVIDDLPPECEVKFAIDLVPGVRPISMAPIKCLEELLKIKFIRHNASSLGAPVLLLKNKNGSIRLYVEYRKLTKVTIKNW